jgi:class 3 adenylate cyclase
MAVSTEERRIVTVLFADMAGSTALGEELDPEEMRRLLTRYYSIARESVEQHGGTVEKFIGDAAMVAMRHARLPFVGRENDLAQLQLAARRTIKEKRPSMVSVIAPAGTGKTRLGEEFLD